MNTSFTVESGVFGPRVVLTGPWRSEVADYMRREQIRELYLNHARGWKGEHIEFVRELPDLLGFGIIDFLIKDVSPVHALHQLKVLELSTYCKTPIDFTEFSFLEQCVFYWRRGSDTLFDVKRLKRLFLHRYNASSSAQISQLRNMERLEVANAVIEEVEGLGELLRLQMLGLYSLGRLKTLRGIERLSGLVSLKVNGCKNIQNIDPIRGLHSLRCLELNDNGKLASLAPVENHAALERVLFYGSTYIEDGDLTVLLSLPLLQAVSYKNRRHYSHRREEIPLITP